MNRRVLAFGLALTLALLSVSAAPVAAADPPDEHPFIHDVPSGFFPAPTPDQYKWQDWLGGWVDVRCGTADEKFRITFYEHEGYGGKKVRVCHSPTNRTGYGSNSWWCELPMGTGASWKAVDGCRKGASNWGTANDKVTSMFVNNLPSGSCIRLFEHKNRGGGWWTFNKAVPNLGIYHVNGMWFFNDAISSSKKKTGDACKNLPKGDGG